MSKASKPTRRNFRYTDKPSTDQVNAAWRFLLDNLWMAPLMREEVQGQLEIIAQAEFEAGVGKDVLGQNMYEVLDRCSFGYDPTHKA